MLLKISSTAPQANNLGFLLHKNPANLHEVEMPFGKASVFYNEASSERCTACLMLEIDPVRLVRRAQQLEDYVNDRPYLASSYMTVAISRVFGTALAGNCQKRPELVGTKLPLKAAIEVIRSWSRRRGKTRAPRPIRPRASLPAIQRERPPALAARTAQQELDDVLDLQDITGKRFIETRLFRNVTIR